MYSWGRDVDEGIGATPPAQSMSAVAIMVSPPPQPQQGQWGNEETKELIRIRSDMERDSAASSVRCKVLWDAVSSEMLRRGFSRTPDQCKCKWKNLLNRYKGKETSDPSSGKQCPFFDELHALFTERAKNMRRLLQETEAGSRKGAKRPRGGPSSEEFSDNEDNANEVEEHRQEQEERLAKSKARRRKDVGVVADVASMLKEFFGHQVRMERRWVEAAERSARERMSFEQERREWMEKAERERLESDRAWREREEERKVREESRAERRDALLTALLNSLINDRDNV